MTDQKPRRDKEEPRYLPPWVRSPSREQEGDSGPCQYEMHPQGDPIAAINGRVPNRSQWGG